VQSKIKNRKSKMANRLAGEKSPYLLQHAHNPVDWLPWGEEAFARSRREDKPIFLSIGYSTCHWCHVMERESFEDANLARLLNESFVPVKVDREERPDVDRVYMAYVQATTGGGGWPLTVFLTPDLKPFFGGTYFPPVPRYGMPSLPEVLRHIREVWARDRARIQESAGQAAAALTESLSGAGAPTAPAAGGSTSLAASGPTAPAASADDSIRRAYEQFHSWYDAKRGGFGPAPKFPQVPVLQFLLRCHARAGDGNARGSTSLTAARDMVLHTLRAMAGGGIHDHLGGGFHRYATDERWFLPHFEKMLYDQAQLACVYLEAFGASGEEPFAATARDILDYVLRDMTGSEGEFYSAEDADSAVDAGAPRGTAADPCHPPPEKAEGRFYVWTDEEIRHILSSPTVPSSDPPRLAASQRRARPPADVFAYHYGVAARGNVASDPHGEFAGRNVLHVAHTLDETARRFGLAPEQVRLDLAAARGRLLEARSARPRPLRDDKTITAWNGLAISAFARAGAVLREDRYLQAAARAAGVVRQRLYDAKTATLLRRLRQGEARGEAFLDDYAFLIQGLLDLYESSLDIQWLQWAAQLQSRQDESFWDPAGGYFATSGRDPSIFLRAKEAADGAEPSPNGISALNLLRLGRMIEEPGPQDADPQDADPQRADPQRGDPERADPQRADPPGAGFTRRARQTLRAFAAARARLPAAMPTMLWAAAFADSPPVQIVLAGRADAPDTRALLREVHRPFLPNKVVLLADGGEAQRWLARRVAFLATLRPPASRGGLDGQAAAYVCRNFTCRLPTTDPAALRRQLTMDH
jgi:hypothetical protein